MLKQRIKKKSLSASSKKWLQRQLNDEYVMKAQKEGYRSRASFKIIEIQQKFKIINKNSTVLDLGSAPGGWSQVIAPLCKRVVAVDLLDMQTLPNVDFIKGDFQSPEVLEKIRNFLGKDKVDVIISDMAPNTCGIPKVDHLRIINLLEEVFDFAKEILSPGGVLVAKSFQGGDYDLLLRQLRTSFEKVSNFKPNASRKQSVEMYTVCLGFRSQVA